MIFTLDGEKYLLHAMHLNNSLYHENVEFLWIELRFRNLAEIIGPFITFL